MTTLVTGGSGFIGSNLCRKLLQLDDTVIALDNLITGTNIAVSDLIKNQRFTFLECDITRPLPHLPHIDRIFHLACPTGVPNCKTYGVEMLTTSIIGTHHVLNLAREHEAQLLFTSSSESYGDPQLFPQKESYWGYVDPVGFRSPYEEGKRIGETLIGTYIQKYKLDAKIVRIFNTYGPGMSTKDLRVIPRFITQALADQPLTVEGNGLQKRTFSYVDDIVEALLTVMRNGKSAEVYNIGSDQEVTIADLARMIIAITHSNSAIQEIIRPKHDPTRRLPDLTKIKLLGWSQKTPLSEGLLKTIAYFQKLSASQVPVDSKAPN